MLILGIETSCDETAASLIEIKKSKIKVLSNIISSQVKKHTPFGGVVPSLAAREHVKNLPRVLKLGLVKTKIAEIDLIAVTAGPGLISSLLVGTAFAKALAWKYQKPIIGVNHMEGHVYSNWLRPVGADYRLSTTDNSLFPALCLIVSGGHTQLVLMHSYGKYKLIGETLDDAAGEAFDKIARILGLGYPGGPAIAKISETGEREKYTLPRPMLNSRDYNFSFAGLKTAVLYLVRDLLKKSKQDKLDRQTTAAIAASAQEAIVEVLVKKTIRAARQYKVKSIMLSGGVSANKVLRQKLTDAGKELKTSVHIPDLAYTTDNAAMIAAAGYFKGRSLKLKAKSSNWNKIRADANWEIF